MLAKSPGFQEIGFKYSLYTPLHIKKSAFDAMRFLSTKLYPPFVAAFFGFLSIQPFARSASAVMRLREAGPSDVDAVVDVLLAAMPDDPAWDYRFQYRKEHPEDHRKFQRLFFKYLIDPSYEDWVVMVAESPSVEDSSVSNIVAFAVWDISYINKRKHGPSYKAKHRSLPHFII
jgi:hypothetical protein